MIAGRWNRILEEDGADAILPMYYSGVMSVLQRKCGDAFFNRMGACDMVRTLCSSAKGAGYEAVMGQTAVWILGSFRTAAFTWCGEAI